MSSPRKLGTSSPKARKPPLRVAALPAGVALPLPRVAQPSATASMTAEQLRAMMISEFCQWLRSRTNQEKRPFQEETITAYKAAARGRWTSSRTCSR